MLEEGAVLVLTFLTLMVIGHFWLKIKEKIKEKIK
jgi:hypothetical protein